MGHCNMCATYNFIEHYPGEQHCNLSGNYISTEFDMCGRNGEWREDKEMHFLPFSRLQFTERLSECCRFGFNVFLLFYGGLYFQ